MEQETQALMERLSSMPPTNKTAVVGFDAVIDTILRPVQKIAPDGTADYFRTIREYGDHISSMAGLSCAVEVRQVARRIGGNMPNLAAALAALGVEVHAVGTMGLPEPDPSFRAMGCTLHSIGPVGSCTALQFSDGKVMLSDMEGARDLGHAEVERALGRELLVRLFGESDLAGFVNWAELPRATEIWRGVAEQVWAAGGGDRSKFLLVDLTDCARRGRNEIRGVAELISECRAWRNTVVSLNLNEAGQLAAALDCPGRTPEALAERLYRRLEIDGVFVHLLDRCVSAGRAGVLSTPGSYVKEPYISVGAGDNFNGALAFGLISGLEQADCARFANLAASRYVSLGRNSTLEDLRLFVGSEHETS